MTRSSALRRARPAADKPRGWWYPWIFVAGFALVIAVNGTLIAFAVKTFSGLETDHAYENGLNYNAALAAARDEARLGWTVSLTLKPIAASGHRAEVDARFRGLDGGIIDNLDVTAYFTRPTVAGYDFTSALPSEGGGRYQAIVSAPLPGAWDVRLVAVQGARSWQMVRRIELP